MIRASSLLLAAVAGLFACQTAEDPANRQRLEESWRLYQQGSDSWPEARDRWYALGGGDRDSLVLTLIADMVVRAPQPVRTKRGTLEPGWKRPQRELLSLPSEGTVPLLEEALRSGRDNVSLEALADTLAGFGAVDSLERAALEPREGDSKASRRHALLGLVKAGGGDAIECVGGMLRNDPDWELRSTAAEALGDARYADRKRAAAALVGGLEDVDPFVFRKVCESLTKLEVRSAAPALALRLDRARRSGEAEAASWTIGALRRLTGVSVPGDDPALWKQAADLAAARGD